MPISSPRVSVLRRLNSVTNSSLCPTGASVSSATGISVSKSCSMVMFKTRQRASKLETRTVPKSVSGRIIVVNVLTGMPARFAAWLFEYPDPLMSDSSLE